MKSTMKSHIISVTVEKSSIQVQPQELRMTLDDEVQWAGRNDRRFTIRFDGGTPFDRHELKHDAAKAKQTPTKKGEFKYSVIAEDDPGLVLDPVVVVTDPPTQQEP